MKHAKWRLHGGLLEMRWAELLLNVHDVENGPRCKSPSMSATVSGKKSSSSSGQSSRNGRNSQQIIDHRSSLMNTLLYCVAIGVVLHSRWTLHSGVTLCVIRGRRVGKGIVRTPIRIVCRDGDGNHFPDSRGRIGLLFIQLINVIGNDDTRIELD
jgi:hypothetical protein